MPFKPRLNGSLTGSTPAGLYLVFHHHHLGDANMKTWLKIIFFPIWIAERYWHAKGKVKNDGPKRKPFGFSERK